MKHFFWGAGLLLIRMLSWGQENLVITDEDVLKVFEVSRKLQSIPDEPDVYNPPATPPKGPTPEEMQQLMLKPFKYSFWNAEFLNDYYNTTDQRRRAVKKAINSSGLSNIDEYSRVMSLVSAITARIGLEERYIGYEHLDTSFLEQVRKLQADIPLESIETVKRNYDRVVTYFESFD